MIFNIDSSSVEILTDTMTPVNMYLKIRNYFSESILLESSDYGAMIIVLPTYVLTR